jgi:hypothetical protein
MRQHHYSGTVTRNTQLHLGAFLDGRLVGVAQFGPPLDRSKLLGLVEGTAWDGMIELNRLALLDDTPRNTESRFLAVCMRLLRQHYPQLGWVVSFADATQCGDGTIYRAAGFVLTAIKANANLARLPDGSTVHKMVLESGPNRPRPELGGRTYNDVTGGRYNFAMYCEAAGATIRAGHQLRYIYFLKRAARSRLTVPELPFTAIAAAGAKMYRGQRPRAGSIDSDAPANHAGEGGASPTSALQHAGSGAP